MIDCSSSFDTKLRIKRFTPLVTKHFNITDEDEGRPITDFTHKLKYDHLADDARAVLLDLTPLEREVENSAGDWLLLRMRPYRTEDNRIEGVVITVIDVTQPHRAQAALREIDQRFRALVNATSYVVYRMSPDWTEMRYLDGRGFIADTPSPSTMWLNEYIDPDDQPLVMQTIQEAVRTKSVFQLMHRVKRTNGTLGWTFSRAIPLLNEAGDITEWFAAASDISAFKEAETKVIEAEARYRAVVETAAESIVVIDPAGFIQSANRATSKMFGYENNELVGANVSILMPPDHARQHHEYLEAYKRTGIRKIIGIGREVEGRRKDGSIFPIELSVSEWRNGGRFFAGVIRDITERKKVEQELAHGAAMARRIASLTKRERDVLELIVAGHVNKEIAARLGISQRTVESYRAAVMKKLSARSLSELVRMEMAARR